MKKTFKDKSLTFNLEGEQNSSLPPPNMPLWHVGYFELKVIENHQSQEKLFAQPPQLPTFTLERGRASGKDLLPGTWLH